MTLNDPGTALQSTDLLMKDGTCRWVIDREEESAGMVFFEYMLLNLDSIVAGIPPDLLSD